MDTSCLSCRTFLLPFLITILVHFVVSQEEPLATCSRAQPCRIVEYSPIIIEAEKDEGSGAGSGQEPTQAYLALEPAGPFGASMSYDESHYTVSSFDLCQCPNNVTCPGANDTSTDVSLKLDTFTALKMCRPLKKLPPCRDYRRPVVRIFRDLKYNGSSLVGMVYSDANVWCNCKSGRYSRLPTIESWFDSTQLGYPFACQRRVPWYP